MNIINKIFNFEVSYEGLYNSGVNLYEKKKYKEALKLFLKAETVKRTSKICYNIGLCYYNLGNLDLAKNYYKKSMQLNSRDTDCMYNLALVHVALKENAKAKELFEKAVKIKKDLDALYGLLILYLKAKDFETVNDLIENYFSSNPEKMFKIAKRSQEFNTSLSDFTYVDFAINILNSLLQNDEKNPDIHYQLSICYSKKAMWQEALNSAKSAVEYASDSFELNENLGIILYYSNEYNESLKYLLKIIKNHKDKATSQTYFYIVHNYRQLEDVENERKYLKLIMKKFPAAKDEAKKMLQEEKK